jgi:SAM-dependent methyltransferase
MHELLSPVGYGNAYMTHSNPVSACCCHFELRYQQHSHPAMLSLERDVLGCDFGGTSWTTREQAEQVPAALGLESGTHLLEIGAGSGWPGLYLAGITGCDVTLLDIPINALRQAKQRAAEEALEGRSRAVVASGTALPFSGGIFEAIGHSDVLCCLPGKLTMMKECRRVARCGARMLFYVIAPAPGLLGDDLEEAVEAGPPFVGIPDDYGKLLGASGWNLLRRSDLTSQYLQALRRLVTGLEAASATLKDVMGPGEFRDQLQRRRRQVDAIEHGLLEREVFLAEAI